MKGVGARLLASMAAVLSLQACGGAKVPACGSSEVEAALQGLFRKQAAAVFQHYVVPNLDPIAFLTVTSGLEMGMQDDLHTVVFINGSEKKISWKFSATGLQSEARDIRTCVGRAAYSRGDVQGEFEFGFQVQATDQGGVFVRLSV